MMIERRALQEPTEGPLGYPLAQPTASSGQCRSPAVGPLL